MPETVHRVQAESPTIAIAATFTAESLKEPLEFWLDELSFNHGVRFALYHQVFQTLLDPGGLFASNRDGVNVVLARIEDWSRHADEPFAAGTLEENVQHFISSVRSSAPALSVPLLVFLCPASPDFLSDSSRGALAKEMEELIASELAPLSKVQVVQSAAILSLYPVDSYYDRAGDELGHIPYTPEFFAGLATAIVRRIHGLRMAPFKVLVLDCDNTLWRGICGEDGPEGVEIDPGRRVLQEFALAQRASGMLLAICSKNNEEDVVETFRLHPEMLLRLEDFTAYRINWEPKAGNLRALAAELDLSLDSFVFIDDDPKECAEIEANCPGVLTLALPPEDEIEDYLRHVWAFDRVKVTREDRERAAHYAQRGERRRFEQQAATLEDFLAGLQLEVRIAPVEPQQLPRAAQLIQRTNQMNCTVVRRTEAELQNLLRSNEADCLVVDASDRFGAYGMVGVMIFGAEPEALAVDTFLMSCRAFGRGIEHQMLAHLGRIAVERGLRRVHVPFVPSARNRPALTFLESSGPESKHTAGSTVIYIFASVPLSNLRYKPAATTSPDGVASREQEQDEARQSFSEYARIARELSRPGQVLAVIQGRRQAAASPASGGLSEPVTGMEKRVASIWSELLGVPTIGRDDNFFDLGGHSLLAVQLLSRLRDEFAVDLSLEVVYNGELTVAELAKTIELYEIGQSDAGEYAAILAELESLSDEEVRAILAQEEAEGPAGSRCESS